VHEPPPLCACLTVFRDEEVRLDLMFGVHARQLTIADCLPTRDMLVARGRPIEAELKQPAAPSLWGEAIAPLRCLGRIDTPSPLGLCADVGGFDRFQHLGYGGWTTRRRSPPSVAAKARSPKRALPTRIGC
ncbi:MAG: hypothetical protein ACXVHK_33080, partial [Solirubrobacteraceae bacterium]